MHPKYFFWSLAAATAVTGSSAALADPERLQTTTRYDVEYPEVEYSGPARSNRVWRLQQQLHSGEVKLQWEPGFGFLPSLLEALDINVDSQVLVFSRTSLQVEHISPQAPRAVYFNDDTYVGFVQGSPLIELTVIDSEKGPVFYGFENRSDYPPRLEREGSRCLTCHDTYSMAGGGVPRVMVLSTPVDDPADRRTVSAGSDVDDRTPFGERWGGWYVTGSTGGRAHFGNLPLREDRGGETLHSLRDKRSNIATLEAYFDTKKYLSPRSDVVALTVLEHQTAIQNLITRVSFKVRTVMSRNTDAAATVTSTGAPRSWADMGPNDKQRLNQIMEPLVRALFFQDAAPFEDRMSGGSGFAERFSREGPRDSKGRGLRELDLQKRLMRYPLSYEVYSRQFDAMPEYAAQYINGRIVEVLQGRDTTGISAGLTEADRKAITEILIETKPVLAPLFRATPRVVSKP